MLKPPAPLRGTYCYRSNLFPASVTLSRTCPSTKETVKLGVYDATLPTILTIDSGDIVSFPDTWSHFLNELQPGVATWAR
jgi:hypothetical protein